MNSSPEIIAEAGSNHNGDPARARELVDLAVQAGASSVKFQFIFAEGLYLSEFFDGQNYVPNPVFEQRHREEMPEEAWRSIWQHAQHRGIAVSASVFCEKGLALLQRLGAPYVKIASTDLTNHALILRACGLFKRVIVSTGMASLSEIDAMVSHVRQSQANVGLELMHCVSAYPCSLSEANTQRVLLLHQAFGLPVGYSDHTESDVSASMALVQGAKFFEKHFTTDRRLPGFDHAHALDAAGLESYVRTLKAAANSLSRPANGLSDREQVTKIRARRGIYASRDLPAGHVLTADDILFVRPSTAFRVTDPSTLIGRRVAQDVPRHAALGVSSDLEMTKSNWEDAHGYWEREMIEKAMTPPAAENDGEIV